MLRSINTALHVIAFGIVVTMLPYSAGQLVAVLGCLIVCWGVTHVALVQIGRRHSTELSGLVLAMILFYWAAYLGKLALAPFLADQYWVVPILIDTTSLLDDLPFGFAIFTIGYAALIAGIFLYPYRSGIPWKIESFNPRLNALAIAIPIGLVIKYILKAKFDIGVPGLEPQYLGVPLLAGALSLVTGTGSIYFANSLFFCALCTGRRGMAILGLILAFANGLIDLRFGAKDTIMYQLVISAAYLLIVHGALVMRRVAFLKVARSVTVLVAVFGILVIGAYRFMNIYRFGLLDGSGVGSAVAAALDSDVAGSRSSFMEIYNRITGLDTLTAVLPLRDALKGNSGIADMLTGSLVENFTYVLMGTYDAATRFSMTQFGYFYLAGGIAALIGGCLFLGALFRFVQKTALRFNVAHPMKLAMLPVLWILFVNTLLGGGNLFLWGKEIGAILIVYYGTARLACAANPSRGYGNKTRIERSSSGTTAMDRSPGMTPASRLGTSNR